jgi:hypothetical protein
MENEPAFIVLDGVLCAVAVLVMNLFPSGSYSSNRMLRLILRGWS